MEIKCFSCSGFYYTPVTDIPSKGRAGATLWVRGKAGWGKNRSRRCVLDAGQCVKARRASSLNRSSVRTQFPHLPFETGEKFKPTSLRFVCFFHTKTISNFCSICVKNMWWQIGQCCKVFLHRMGCFGTSAAVRSLSQMRVNKLAQAPFRPQPPVKCNAPRCL